MIFKPNIWASDPITMPSRMERLKKKILTMPLGSTLCLIINHCPLAYSQFTSYRSKDGSIGLNVLIRNCSEMIDEVDINEVETIGYQMFDQLLKSDNLSSTSSFHKWDKETWKRLANRVVIKINLKIDEEHGILFKNNKSLKLLHFSDALFLYTNEKNEMNNVEILVETDTLKSWDFSYQSDFFEETFTTAETIFH